MIENWLQDSRYALRSLLRRPYLSLGIVLVLALGMGATITVFSVVDAVLLRPLPVAEPEELVLLQDHDQRRNEVSTVIAYPDLLDWQQAAANFETLAGYPGAGLLGRRPERHSHTGCAPGNAAVRCRHRGNRGQST